MDNEAMRKALEDLLRHVSSEIDAEELHGPAQLVARRQCRKGLKPLRDAARAALASDGWVRVEDGLPEKYENVIVVLGGKVQPLMAYISRCCNDDEVWFFNEENGDAVSGITHWRPLPAGPKGTNP